MRFVIASLISLLVLGLLFAYAAGLEHVSDRRAQRGDVAVTLTQKVLFATAHCIYHGFVPISFLVLSGGVAIAAALEEHAKNCRCVRPEVGLGPRA